MTALLNIPTDTRYLGIDGTPLTQVAVEQLERNWTRRNWDGTDWLARVVITQDGGDQRMAYAVAIGQLKNDELRKNFNELVALRIADAPESLQEQLYRLPLGLLMF